MTTENPSNETPVRTCGECRHCFIADFGYSNYTVEGSSVYCELRLHDDDEGFDLSLIHI